MGINCTWSISTFLQKFYNNIIGRKTLKAIDRAEKLAESLTERYSSIIS